MCGIFGILKTNGKKVDRSELAAMGDSLICRGPDDFGLEVKHSTTSDKGKFSIGLGHRRLSIIDLSVDGRQPMTNEDHTILLTFNGEIYNYKKLRRQLRQKGHVFKSSTDSEVIIHLYEEHGLEAVCRLNGMFAFALWDQNKKRLFIGRDRIGIKPVVYHWDGKTLTLASEIKAILCGQNIKRHIDNKALMLYLAYGYIPAPYTIYEGIRKLPPGHMLVLERNQIEISSYWDVNITNNRHISQQHLFGNESIAKKSLFETLSDSVRCRMVADVPLGAFLSGGIDSSIIVALMATQTSKPVKTFSIGFNDDPLYDETAYALDVARMYRTDHHEIKLSFKDMLDVFPTVLDTFDEPFGDSSAIPTYIVSRETRKHVTVALSGDGGDELFAGYRSYLAEYWQRKYSLIPSLLRNHLLEPAIGLLRDNRDTAVGEHIRRAKKFIRGTKGGFHERVLALKEIFPQDFRNDILLANDHSSTRDNPDPAPEWAIGFLDRFDCDNINRILYFDLKDSLPGDMLNKVDWMSMKNSLEVRVPFLDHRVVELAFGIPGAVKMRGGITKRFLKDTFKSILPKSLQNRPKAGFEIPISRWLRDDMRHLVDSYLDEGLIRDQGIFNHVLIKDLVHKHMHRETDTSWMLWNLVAFQYWYQKYIG